MQRFVRLALAAACALAPTAGFADDRDFCADRPGRGTPACTLQPGAIMLEVGAVQYDRDADALSVTRTWSYADTLVRYGLDDVSELQVGLGGYANATSIDRASAERSRARGIGDAYLAYRRGLAGANGPAAVEAFVTLPTGRSPAGAGDWGAGFLAPFSHDLPAGFQLALTPEIDAAVNASGHGRHLALGGVAGLSHAIGKTLSGSAELAVFQDQDPAGHALDARLAQSLAWQVSRKFQLDFEADEGVTHAAPRTSFMLGFAARL